MILLNIRKLPATLALIAASWACCAGANADASADDAVQNNDFRLGSYTVFYRASSDDLSGPYVPSGVNFHIDNLETLYIGYVRRLSAHFSAELAIGYPPLTKTYGAGPATLGSVPYNGQAISTARWLAPTGFLEYNFLAEDAVLRPFIGVGLNYTNFYDRRSTEAGDAASGGPTRIELPPSVGPAVTAGLAYRIAPRWHAYASYSASKVNTRLTAITGGVDRTSHIEFNPQVLVVSIGYAF
jgi:outer membrane protein